MIDKYIFLNRFIILVTSFFFRADPIRNTTWDEVNPYHKLY